MAAIGLLGALWGFATLVLYSLDPPIPIVAVVLFGRRGR